MSDAAKRRHSFAMAYLLGLTGPVLPLSQREPVAYLYNGVPLPGLPEVEGHEFKVIYCSDSANKIWLRCSKDRFIYGNKTGSNGTNYVSTYTDTYWESSIDHSAGESIWSEIIEGKGHSYNDYYVSTGTKMTLIWANHDVTYDQYSDEDLIGTVALSASVPIPVYE